MKAKSEVIITDECNSEIDKICGYIRKNLFVDIACNNLLSEILKIIDILEYSPFIYPKIIRYKSLGKNYRKITIKNYVIVYDVDETNNKVYLDHMFYGKSNYINKI